MLFQLLDGAPTEALVLVGLISVVLALARIVKHLPQDSVTKFFEHRTAKYRIMAGDSKGRVAAIQKQRLVFLGFVITCAAVVALVLVNSKTNEVPPPHPVRTTSVVSSPGR